MSKKLRSTSLLSGGLVFFFTLTAAAQGRLDTVQAAKAGSPEAGLYERVPQRLLTVSQDDSRYGEQTIRDDIGLFRVPLLGTIDGFGVRYASSDSGFRGLDQQSVYIDFRLPFTWILRDRFLVQPRLTLEGGRITRGSDERAFGSFGPSMRISSATTASRWFTDIGLMPTVIDGARYEGDDFGTSFNFTSFVGLGRQFGENRRHELRLRFQHVSNGGINDTNPGINMVGIDFTFRMR